MGKFKKIFIIFLLILVTVGCIALGIKSRYDARLKIDTIKNLNDEVVGYGIKTSLDNLVLIDGGSNLNKETILNYINANGGTVEYWFVTNMENNKFGALNEILEENSSLVNNIIVSQNSDDWYRENSGAEYTLVYNFLNNLRKEEVMDKVQNATLRQVFKLDNLKIEVLKIAGIENREEPIHSQTMVLKIDNMFKSVMFLNRLPVSLEKDFINNNLDKLDSDVLCSYRENIGDELKTNISPEVILDKSESTLEIW